MPVDLGAPGMKERWRAALRWRRWFAPLVVIAALGADYGSPRAMWTAIVPLAFMAGLLVWRERVAALAVLLLSSWIGLPLAAGLKWGVDAILGTHQLMALSGCVKGQQLDTMECSSAEMPGVDKRAYEECYSHELERDLTDVSMEPAALGEFHERVTWSFAHHYNRLALWRARRQGRLVCDGGRSAWTILPSSEAQSLQRPCTRDFAVGLSGHWPATPEDVVRAEARLPDAITAAFARVADPERAWKPAHYHRQYAGFLREGKRVLYLNAVGHQDGPAAASGNRFRDGSVTMCDGGTGSFGAVFDLERNAFDSFAFNGTIAGPVRLR